jgi:hypothetical protein
MPNHTTNVLVCNGETEDIKAILEMVMQREEDGELNFDFNSIVPMPEDLQITSGSAGDQAYACLHGTEKDIEYYLSMPWVKEAGVTTREELIPFLEKGHDKNVNDGLTWRELGDRYASNLKNYGAKTWYDWCCENWGTKWNAYNSEITEDDVEYGHLVISFQTAWSPPTPVYEALAEKFPNVDIEGYWSDEGSYSRERVF